MINWALASEILSFLLMVMLVVLNVVLLIASVAAISSLIHYFNQRDYKEVVGWGFLSVLSLTSTIAGGYYTIALVAHVFGQIFTTV